MESEEAHARVDGEWDESEAERLDIDASDAETSFKLAHKRSLGAARMEFGIDYRTKKREIDHTYYEFAAENEGDPVAYELDTTIGSLIEETRIDPSLLFSGDLGVMAWDEGLPYATTDSDIEYRQAGEATRVYKDYNKELPPPH